MKSEVEKPELSDMSSAKSAPEADVLDFAADDVYALKDGGPAADSAYRSDHSRADKSLEMGSEYVETGARVIPIERTEDEPYGKKVRERYNKKEGYTERRYEDGTVEKEYDDGLKVTRVAGGANLVEQPGGWTIIMNPYGQDHLYGPNGEVIHASRDHHKDTRDKDGNRYINEDHRRELIDKNGRVIRSANGPEAGGKIHIWDEKQKKYRSV